MNKLYKIFLGALMIASCAQVTDTDMANALLDEARQAVANNSFDEARGLIDSLRNTYPKEVDVRKAALTFMDSLEMKQAQQDLQTSDSIVTFKEFELKDLKQYFVLEKQDRYQTTGYYVTKDYAGSKSAYDYFTEVEEGGTLLAVTISRSSGIKYNFTSVEVDFDSNIVPACPLSRSLSQKEQRSYENCYRLAKCMQELTEEKAKRQKYNLKVRFFQKKIEKDADVLSGE